MTKSATLELLRDTIAPEANHVLTEPPGFQKCPDDFGWFCREHAFITSVFCQAFGHPVNIIRGDVSIKISSDQSFTTRHTRSDRKHWWCSGAISPILDLSLNLTYFPSEVLLAHRVIDIGANGQFTIIVDANLSAHDVCHTTPHIIYTPIETEKFTAFDLAFDPIKFLRETDSVEITSRLCVHLAEMFHGESEPYINRLPQARALIDLCKYKDIQRKLQCIASSNIP